MRDEVILKKLEQIDELLGELDGFLAHPFAEFEKNTAVLRASERNFQLIVDLASDINAQLIFQRGAPTPESYRQSFLLLGKFDILDPALADELSRTTSVRNMLVHEYDLEDDHEQFYADAKKYAPKFREYVRVLLNKTNVT